jgi:hypothetical protein
MNPTRTLRVVSLLALLAGGCGYHAYPFAKAFYLPVNVNRLSEANAVAVYRFANKQGVSDPFRYGVAWVPRPVFQKASEPVAIGVTRAFADGLRAAGLPVIDMTGEAFMPGLSKASAPVALSGDVLDFWAVAQWSSGYREVTCTVKLQIYELPSGEKRWEKTYSSRATHRSEAVNRSVARALAGVVETALNDPELIRHLGAGPAR